MAPLLNDLPSWNLERAKYVVKTLFRLWQNLGVWTWISITLSISEVTALLIKCWERRHRNNSLVIASLAARWLTSLSAVGSDVSDLIYPLKVL